MYIVLLNGHVGCLKTTLSYLIAPALRLGHISTSVLGEFVAQTNNQNFLKLRSQRYTRAARIAEIYLQENQSIILDGNYTYREWREEIYDLAVTYGALDVISITCISSRPEAVRDRLEYRRRFAGVPDAKANNMDAYWGSVKDFEPIDDDQLPDGRRISRIEFDSGTLTVSLLESKSRYAQDVMGVISHLISSDRLTKPFFTAPQIVSKSLMDDVEKRRLWIEMEGIGGSGKTTQCNLLLSSLQKIYPKLFISNSAEFSASSMGDFLRSRLNCGNGFMLDFGDSNYAQLMASLTVLADNVKKGEIIANDASWDIAILDAYKGSRIAHTLAFIPINTPNDIREQVKSAIETLVERYPPIEVERITFFLDCPAEFALKRLEQRHNISFGKEFLSFLQNLEAEYNRFIADHPEIHRIDATQSIDAVQQEILRVVAQKLIQP